MIQNQCLLIPPDHPLAMKFYDAVEIQFALIRERHSVQCSGLGDVARIQIIDRDIKIVGDIIHGMQDEIRRERGGDSSCTVGLTYDQSGGPVVVGRRAPIKLN